MTKKSLGMYTEKYNGYIKPRVGRMKLKDVKDISIHAQLRSALVKAVGTPFSPVFPNRNGGHMDDDTLYRRWRSFYRELDIYMGAKVYRNKIIEHAAAQDLTPYCLSIPSAPTSNEPGPAKRCKGAYGTFRCISNSKHFK